MFKNLLKGLSIILGIVLIAGCTSSKGVEMRHYVDVKDRVDQKMEDGNAGYLSGTPQPEDRSQFKKTRKIYVLEVSQEAEGDESIVDIDDSSYGSDAYMDDSAQESQNVIEVSRQKQLADSSNFAVVSPEDSESIEPESTVSFVEYTVEKDDTLQKISKKFYDSYSKWPKIYEKNKEVIDNPDRIKPGIVIQIPME